MEENFGGTCRTLKERSRLACRRVRKEIDRLKKEIEELQHLVDQSENREIMISKGKLMRIGF